MDDIDELDDADVDALPTLQVKHDAFVKQSNRLGNASYYLTRVEQKIVYAIISQLAKEADDVVVTKINVSDLARLCRFERSDAYKQIRKATVTLMQRVIHIKRKDGGEYLTHWVQVCQYFEPTDEREACVVYHVDRGIKDDLLKLHKAYISCKLDDLYAFRSQYAMRLYMIFLEWENKGRVSYTVDKFKHLFELDRKKGYAIFGNLKARVIEPAIEQINENSDLHVTYNIKKGGRGNKVQEITFIIKRKNPSMMTDAPIADLDIPAVDVDAALDAEDEMLSTLIRYGVDKREASKLVRVCGVEQCSANAKYVLETKKGVENLPGMIVRAIEGNWVGQIKESKDIERREKERQRKKERERTDAALNGIIGKKQAELGDEAMKEIIARLGESREDERENNILTDFSQAGISIADARKIVTRGLDVLPEKRRAAWEKAGYKVESLRQRLIFYDMKRAAEN